ncbi:conserved hypothetical protein [Parvibaculum lavamentivorans DS-1]|uniref:PepSY domain-containing protein n=1 Tax=Parvibaculum lavamentivorans (strain DS-1 / DSM 13023 / NCIMB 13966) TaxID=402881 RepID=A7HVA0_PARL1|nr:PepSY domain-containing protein [Parvibaculum lavamentivorans]ABS63833.1 conserved hypothetical protein [Parvibaculum lavamentivorans DS-1]
MKSKIFAAALLLAVPATSLPALATDDRAPTAEERERIEEVLRGAGYVSWEEIEFDDNRWEVDDARDEKGREFDVKLDPESYEIVSTREDD